MEKRKDVRVVFMPVNGAVMTPDEVRKELGKFSAKDGVGRALAQILSVRTAGAMADSAGTNLSADARAHIGGRMAELMSLREELSGYFGGDR